MKMLKNALLGAAIFPLFLLAVGTAGLALFAVGFGVAHALSDNEGWWFVGGCISMTIGVGAYIGTQQD